jgi:hypothetical protein
MKRRIVGVALASVLSATVVTSATGAATLSASGAGATFHAPVTQLDPDRPAPPPVGRERPLTPGPNSTSYSFNWSGYVATASTAFTSVSSTFVQPAVTCPVSGATTVFWVGLDGWTNGTVEQDGTDAYCAGSNPIYFAWWEMYPTNTIQATFGVSPGDKIRASVRFSRDHFTLTVRDLTSGTVRRTVEACATDLTCERSSAEWVIERPALAGEDYFPLADWGTASLADDRAATGGKVQQVSQFPHTAVDMVNNAGTTILATVGALGADGDSFADTWDAAG